MNLTEKILAKLIEIEEDACWYQQTEGLDDPMHSAFTALRRQVEKHKADEKYDLFCVECEKNFCLTGDHLSVEITDCTFIEEVATDLGISE